MLASLRLRAFGMKIRFLIERDGVVGVGIAEDVATVAAVVAALEDREGFLADRRITNEGVGVGFPV